MKKKLTAVILALLMLAAPLVSCTGGDEKNPGGDTETRVEGEVVEKTTVLTNVYSGIPVTVPEGFTVMQDIQPVYDKESGELKLICSKYEEILDENGEWVGYKNTYSLLTYDKDYNLLSDEPLELTGDEDENIYVNNGAITDSGLLFLQSSWDNDKNEFYLYSYNSADKTLTKSEELSRLFSETERGWFYIQYMCVSPDGTIYLGSENEILALDSSYVKQFSVPISNWIDSMSISPDGKLYVSSYFDEGRGIALVDPEKKALGEPQYFNDNPRGMYFGDGYDIYMATDTGVYGTSLSDGSSEILMNFQNSDIQYNRFDILRIIDKDTFLVSETDEETWENTLSIYRKSADVDLSQVKVVEIAAYGGTDNSLNSAIIKYNKANRDRRIVISDYSQYSTNEDYYAGAKKLTTDIVNGLYEPDIVLGNSWGEGNSAVSQIIERDLFIDLNTLIESDPDIDPDDIFGGVKRTFSTSDGRMWGITKEFNVNTLIAKDDMLGGKTSWTLDEMLDYAKNLPEGVRFMENLTQQNALTGGSLGSDLLSAFINVEEGSCNFENETFYKLLDFIKSLPAEYIPTENDDNYYEAYQTGKIAVYNDYFYDIGAWIGMEVIFNTKDITPVGFPIVNEGDCGSLVVYDNSFTITTFCDYPEIAWDFLSGYIKPEYDEKRSGFTGIYSMPIFKSMYDIICEEYYTYEFTFNFRGGASWGPMDPENPMTVEDLDEPGILTYFTKEDSAELREFIDNGTGWATASSVPEEITNIVTEEISSFTSGVKTAEDCARVIQSRVSIWLAEHE